jgi:diaminopimelate decarboxylase
MFLLGTQRVNDAGHLEIGGCDTVRLAERFGTPLYVMDETAVRDACRAYRRAFESRYPHVTVAYASKAFLVPAMARLIDEEGLDLDVASGGELHVGLVAGFPAKRVVFHGNNKGDDEVGQALDAGVGRFVIDNAWEAVRLDEVTQARRRTQAVWLRVAPGVDPHTHRRIRTGQQDTKFGFNIASGAALEAVVDVVRRPGLLFTGLHAHIGSNLREMEAHVGAIEALLDLAVAIREETGLSVEELNVGGGLGIRYVPGDHIPSIDAFADHIVGSLVEGLASRHLPLPHLHLEPGRSIVGEAGTTLYRVGATKVVPINEAPGERAYVAIDGGLSDNPRPQLYDAVYHAAVANRMREPITGTYRIAGKHCETDTLIDAVTLPHPRPGDLLAVPATGAYGHAMASNYNRLPRAAVVFVRDGHARLAARRETLDDLLRLDVLPDDPTGAPVPLA